MALVQYLGHDRCPRWRQALRFDHLDLHVAQVGPGEREEDYEEHRERH